jgi:hypothetical protein
LAGSFMVIIPMLSVAYYMGYLPQLMDILITRPLVEVFVGTSLGDSVSRFISILPAYTMLLGFCGVATFSYFTYKKTLSYEHYLAWGLFVINTLMLARLFEFRPADLLLIVPPAIYLVLIALSGIVAQMEDKMPKKVHMLRKLVKMSVYLILLALIMLVVVTDKSNFDSDEDRIWVSDNKEMTYRDLTQLSEELEIAKKGQSVFVIGNLPQVYLHLGYLPDTPYLSIESDQKDFRTRMLPEIKRYLEQRQPTFLVVDLQSIALKSEGAALPIVSENKQFIKQNYRKMYQSKHADIYVHK